MLITFTSLEKLLETAKIVPAVNQVEYVLILTVVRDAQANECNHRLHPYLASVELKEYCDKKGIHLTAYTPTGWFLIM